MKTILKRAWLALGFVLFAGIALAQPFGGPGPQPGQTLRTVTWTSSTSWTVPSDVSVVWVDACAVGGAGAGGQASANTAGSGGGGGAGCMKQYPLQVAPSGSVTVTIASQPIGGTVGITGANGGATSLSGSGLVDAWPDRCAQAGPRSGSASAGTGTSGGAGGGVASSAGGAVASGGATQNTTALTCIGGTGAAGGSNTSGSPGTASGSGIFTGITSGSGTGGGGAGGNSAFGVGTVGNAAGVDCSLTPTFTGYGGGGGGGGTNARGCPGGPAFIRLTYWSAIG